MGNPAPAHKLFYYLVRSEASGQMVESVMLLGSQTSLATHQTNSCKSEGVSTLVKRGAWLEAGGRCVFSNTRRAGRVK